MKINRILETKEVAQYLRTRDIEAQYQKIKKYIILGHLSSARLKKREPKEHEIWSFRINRKFRAFAYLEHSTLKVFHIDDHQEGSR